MAEMGWGLVAMAAAASSDVLQQICVYINTHGIGHSAMYFA